MKLFDAKVKSSVRKWDTHLRLNAGGNYADKESLLRWAHKSSAIAECVANDMFLYEEGIRLFHEQVQGTLLSGGEHLAHLHSDDDIQ